MKRIVKALVIICAVWVTAMHANAQVSVGISVRVGPPAIPVYTPPPCPVDGYLWQPGYWAYDDADGYYWVPGVWVAPPTPGYYWTPPYWGFVGGVYGFHVGYWGPHVGFYGGINYGYGYSGHGYYGGRWDGGRFRYNTAVVRVNRTVIHNTYVDRRVIVHNTNRVSFNGGRGGVRATPRPAERAAMRDHHVAPTAAQMSHQQSARGDRNSFAKNNHGRPTFGNNHATVPSHGNPAQHGGRPSPQQHSPNVSRPTNHSAPAQHNMSRPSPQQHTQRTPQHNAPSRSFAPQQHSAPHPAPQQHMQAPRPAPQQHMQAPRPAPQQHMQAPRPAPAPHMSATRPAPAPHMGGGGGGGRHH